jgi:hypothetical protein
MILNALVTILLAPLAWLAVRELRLASTTSFVDNGTWRDIRRHEDLGSALLHFLMLIVPIVAFVIFLGMTLMGIFVA